MTCIAIISCNSPNLLTLVSIDPDIEKVGPISGPDVHQLPTVFPAWPRWRSRRAARSAWPSETDLLRRDVVIRMGALLADPGIIAATNVV